MAAPPLLYCRVRWCACCLCPALLLLRFVLSALVTCMCSRLARCGTRATAGQANQHQLHAMHGPACPCLPMHAACFLQLNIRQQQQECLRAGRIEQPQQAKVLP